jgi:glycine hydroxymethyltransferase
MAIAETRNPGVTDGFFEKSLAEVDPEIFSAVEKERERQQHEIELIASENIVSRAVLETAGSVLTNKYAEGYPGKRYYGGCQYVDIAEELAIERAKKLFDCAYANVQPNSGSQANQAVFLALMEPGDSFMGLDLAAGGHLTHGSPVNVSGKWFEVASYGVGRETGTIDMDEVAAKARESKPKIIIAGGSAYARFWDFARFREIADEVGAYLFVDMAHVAGLVAGGVHPSPFPHAHVATTTTHKTLRGPRGGAILCKEEHAKAIDKAVFPGWQGGPLEHVIAGKAIAFREAMDPSFREYAHQIVANASALASALVGEGFRLVSGGTDNHLMVVDLTPFDADLTGKQAQTTLDEAGITLNKNTIPDDPRSPFVTSGVRIGTPSVTTQGMTEPEMSTIASLIARALRARDDDGTLAVIRKEVAELCARFPAYPHGV